MLGLLFTIDENAAASSSFQTLNDLYNSFSGFINMGLGIVFVFLAIGLFLALFKR